MCTTEIKRQLCCFYWMKFSNYNNFVYCTAVESPRSIENSNLKTCLIVPLKGRNLNVCKSKGVCNIYDYLFTILN